MSEDIRWKQRFNSYAKAMQLLQSIVAEKDMSHKGILAIVQAYEMVVELGWNLLKDYMTNEGVSFVATPISTVRQAFNKQIIPDGQVWIDAIKKRNLSSHTYNEKIATAMANDIIEKFLPAFCELQEIFAQIIEEDPIQ